MRLTDYHAKYIAHELTRRFPSDSAEKLAGAVASAQVDLNPHEAPVRHFQAQRPPLRGRVRQIHGLDRRPQGAAGAEIMEIDRQIKKVCRVATTAFEAGFAIEGKHAQQTRVKRLFLMRRLAC